MSNTLKNSFTIAFIFLGMFVGAGFCTGQETFQYFNKNNGTLLSLVFGTLLLFLNFFIVLRKINEEKIDSFDKYVEKTSNKVIGKVFKIFIIIIAFTAFFAMQSAAGSLFEQIFKNANSYKTGVITLSLLCFIVFIMQAKGVLVVNSIISPIKIIGIPILTIIAIKNSHNISSLRNKDYIKEILVPLNTAMLYSSFLSASCYVSFNAVTSGSILVPFKELFNKKTVKWGAIIGASLIGMMHLAIWLSFKLYSNDVETLQVPMLHLAKVCDGSSGFIYQAVYLMLVLSGTFTTAVSTGFAVISQINIKSLKARIFYSALLCIVTFPLAFIKLSTVVGKIFGFMGYAGFIWMIIAIWDYLSKGVFNKK